MARQQNLDIFPINSARDILCLPQVEAKRQALIKLYKAGSEEIPQAKDEYLDLVNGLCKKHGLKPYFVKGPAHPQRPTAHAKTKGGERLGLHQANNWQGNARI